MKKQLHFAFVFLVLLVTSCATDKLEVQENYNTNPESVWAYDGNNTTIKGVIKELREGSNRASLERRLLKNDVLWDKAKFVLIDNKKRILVPFLSEDKENVIGVLNLVKNTKGKTMVDMTVRTRLMAKNNILPFWDKGIWLGYFMALDKNILGIKNGNPGFTSRPNPSKSLTQKEVCGTYEVETIHYSYYYTVNSSGEASNFGVNEQYSTYEYYPYCYWAADEEVPTPNPDLDPDSDNTGGDGNPPIPPCDQIKNMLTETSTNNLKSNITWLQSKVNSSVNNIEYGVNVEKKMNPDESYRYEYTQVTNNQNLAVSISTGGSSIGGLHSHPSNGVAIFSFQDVRFLLSAYDNGSSTRKDDAFNGLVCKDNSGNTNTYMLKISDINALRTQVNTIWNDPKYAKYSDEEARIKAIHKYESQIYDKSNGQLEKTFLDRYKNFGIKIYKADASLNNFNQLQLNNSSVTQTPCN